MDEDILFPKYIHRDEEEQIQQQIALVAAEGKSRAVLLYGPGGIGKTWLVRELPAASNGNDSIAWVAPVDVDDSEYWLLSNLERHVAAQLDPEYRYFGPYVEYLSRLPSFTRSDISHETVLSHLGRIKQIFVQCYRRFVEETGKTVVIVFDTIETIRGMYLQVTITQWMKALPATLFILSGRPPREAEDPIKDELSDPHQRIPVSTVRLTEFSRRVALEYLKASSISAGLDLRPPGEEGVVGLEADEEQNDDEKQVLVLLTRGHPLWLAFAISYLKEKGMPEEAAGRSLEEIEREIPYRGDMTPAGQNLHEEFKRRLVTPYREADFWHEAIKRLAVVRQSVNEDMWLRLMADHPLPAGVSLGETWAMVLQTPWIRKRANGRFVTLHDAVAEELAQRIIPLHDQDQHWRRQLWERAVDIYIDLTDGPEAALEAQLTAVDDQLRALGPSLHRSDGDQEPGADQSAFIRHVAALDAQKRQLDQLKAGRLFYQLLCDPATGCNQFLGLFDDAIKQHNVLFEDLLALEMQRFLPDGAYAHTLGDVIGSEIERFRSWLARNPARYIDICLTMAEYFLEERPEETMALLDHLEGPPHQSEISLTERPTRPPADSADYTQHYRIHILRGNACMRIPGRVRDGLRQFELALGDADSEAVPARERPKLVAKAYKELGFYYRNEGMWREADDAYQRARDSILPTMTKRSPDEDREEMASIQTNWAYVKGLVGKYREGSNLVESAITVRRRLNKRQEEGNSWSVCGEVYRYERRFQKSWDAFAQAEQIFLELRNWSWLGVVYQEQAICLYQATHDGINLLPGRDPVDQAKRLVTRAVDICRDQFVRGYPSALNRAGRIFGEDVDTGIGYLAEGIDWARRLSDGWFLLANLVEYVEANYRAWSETQKAAYIDQITARQHEVEEAMSEYEFPDLKGRWELLQGHLAIRRWQDNHEPRELNLALENYKDGFKLIAQGYVGSSGAAALPGEFATFAKHLDQLPADVQADWQEELRREWSTLGEGSTLVLARLEELY
jgi:tetratricopeptide (TPR) repeat protein